MSISESADKYAAAHYNFRMKLEMPALKQLLDDVPRLADLRYDLKQLESYKKTFKLALFELKIDLDEAVLKASRPAWDSEDDEKQGPLPAPETHDDPAASSDSSDIDLKEMRAKRMAHFAFPKH